MRALILTAGLGTRLRPLTYVRAKAAVPVNGSAIVRRMARWLADEGIRDLVLNLHHHPASIAASVGDGQDLGVRARYTWEDPVLGSAGGPRRALPLLVEGDPAGAFLIVNGDTLTDLRIAPLVDRHRASGALVTMVLTPNPRPDVYGGVLVDGGGNVTGFTRRGAAPDSFHFVGIQVAEARAFAPLPEGVPAESVNQLYPQLIRDLPGAIAAHVVDAPFKDIGTPDYYLQTSLALAAVEGNRRAGGRQTTIDPTAEVDRTAVWDNVSIGADARLTECIVCDGVRIPAGARYARCAIVPARPPGAGESLEGDLLIKRF